MTFYYDNLLHNHNYTAKPNVVWAADITSFELNRGKKVYVYLCIDIFTNRVIVSLFRTKVIQTNDIIKKLNQAIDKRLPIKPVREVIIHTDPGTQFTSKSYRNFIKQREGYIVAIMSRKCKPKDNPVAERFMRTFKEHKINDRTFQEELFYQIKVNSKFQGYRKVFNEYVKSLNLKPNRKSNSRAPERHCRHNITIFY
jgi:transposase InsO family protein